MMRGSWTRQHRSARRLISCQMVRRGRNARSRCSATSATQIETTSGAWSDALEEDLKDVHKADVMI